MNKKLLTTGFPLAVAIGLIASAFLNKSQSEPRMMQTIEVPVSWEEEGYPADVVPGSIYDGDTLRVTSSAPELAQYADAKGQIKIRFACIDAPEMAQARGTASRDKLRSFLQSGKVTVNPVDVDRYGRVVAEVWDKDGLVQSYMATAGAAFPYEQYKEDCPNWDAVSYSAEMAKEQRLGVWADAVPEYPWEWRRK